MTCANCDLAWRMLGMSSEERLAIVLARRANGEGRIKTFSIVDVAHDAGMTRETATRIMSEWHAAGKIERRFGGTGVVLKKFLLELAQALADGRVAGRRE